MSAWSKDTEDFDRGSHSDNFHGRTAQSTDGSASVGLQPARHPIGQQGRHGAGHAADHGMLRKRE